MGEVGKVFWVSRVRVIGELGKGWFRRWVRFFG